MKPLSALAIIVFYLSPVTSSQTTKLFKVRPHCFITSRPPSNKGLSYAPRQSLNIVGDCCYSSSASGSKRKRKITINQLTKRRSLTNSEDNSRDENNKEPELYYRDQTIRWMERFIIGMEICPFAVKPYRKQQIDVKVLLGQDKVWIQSQILEEMKRLKRTVMMTSSNDGLDDATTKEIEDDLRTKDLLLHGSDTDQKNITTTLFVTPDLYPEDFISFLNFVRYDIEEFVHQSDEQMEEYVQLVTFHPRYQFEGSFLEDIDNYTNRSPYPMIHLLRELDVTNAVESMPNEDASVVWQRNIDLLHALSKQILMPMLRRRQTCDASSSKGDSIKSPADKENKIMVYDDFFLHQECNDHKHTSSDVMTRVSEDDESLKRLLRKYKPSNYWKDHKHMFS